ncbi:MAG: CorA family divalent cation transporter [Methanoregula sp.]
MDPDKASISSYKTDDSEIGEEQFMRWKDWQELEESRRFSKIRNNVNAIFSEGLMIAVSLILIPVLIIPYLVPVPPDSQLVLNTIDGTILIIFILEYSLKLAVAENRRQFVGDPWHILDLFIVIVPIAGILTRPYQNITGAVRLLRLTRIPAVGARAYSRQDSLSDTNGNSELKSTRECTVRTLLPAGTGREAGWTTQLLSDIPDSVSEETRRGPEGTILWQDFTSVQKKDLLKIHKWTGVPLSLLDQALRERAFPWTRAHSNSAAVYLKLMERRRSTANPKKMYITWKWILIVSKDHQLLTFSGSPLHALDLIAREALASSKTITPAEITYRFFQDALSEIEETLRAIEDELEYTGSLTISEQPASFLRATFKLKKESVKIHSWLLHTRDVLNSIVTSKVVLHGMEDGSRFSALLDRASYLYDISDDTTENVSSLTDYYFDATSFQMSRVMKLIAVLTALAIIPTIVGGLLGANLMGNPWPISLAQMVTIVGIAMIATAWVFYRLGWFKS